MQRRIADIKKDISAHSARSAWDKGSSFKEVKKMTKAGKGCGHCKKKVKKLTKKLLEKQNKND